MVLVDRQTYIYIEREAILLINWILGGLIFSLVIVIVVKNVRRLQKGETTCSGCSLQETTNCSCPHRDT
ncbi:hypothetical protein PMSM_07200 [Paenibacillus macquariensis subsp. macquariensis]|nr:hypothetical protein PMSM_07200 [Paenibacillus macquariensis subsp. macquariensis]